MNGLVPSARMILKNDRAGDVISDKGLRHSGGRQGNVRKIDIKYSIMAAQGANRASYQDNFLCDRLTYADQALPLLASGIQTEDRQVYAVFDGVGRQGGGKEAALLAAQTLQKYRDTYLADPRKDIEKYSIMYLMEVNTKICEIGTNQSGTRTGASAALFCMDERRGYVYNVGDSRAYLLRSEKFYVLSEDHTEANRLYRLGALNERQYRECNRKRRLTQYLGIPAEELVIKPHKASFRLKRGDRILLCTNGLTRLLEECEIKELLQKPSERYAEEIWELIRAKGSRDDCTVLICECRQQGCFG